MTKEELEIEKLGNEIALIKKQSWREYQHNLRSWIAMVFTIASVGIAAGTLYVPIMEYLDKKSSETIFSINKEMIESLTGEENPDQIRRSIAILSYYEVNAIPLLLFRLELESFRDSPKVDLIDLVKESIIGIYNQANSEEKKLKTFSSLLKALRDLLERDFDKETVSQINIKGITNYLDILAKLELLPDHLQHFNLELDEMSNLVGENPSETQTEIWEIVVTKAKAINSRYDNGND